MTRSASALPKDIDTLEAMLVAKRWRRPTCNNSGAKPREGLDRPDGDTQRACPGADRRSSCDHQEAGGRRFGRSSEKLEGDQQAFACDEIQTGLDANESELEVTRPTGEPRRAARSRKAFPAHLERSRPSSSPEPWRKKHSRSQSPSPIKRGRPHRLAKRNSPTLA